jgi:N-methylhydantoinase A/oxoprolinase/acetone carboxylase beta subunit
MNLAKVTMLIILMAIVEPTKTILSGPASSIIGGILFTKTCNALVLDMGETTTDILGEVKTVCNL